MTAGLVIYIEEGRLLVNARHRTQLVGRGALGTVYGLNGGSFDVMLPSSSPPSSSSRASPSGAGSGGVSPVSSVSGRIVRASLTASVATSWLREEELARPKTQQQRSKSAAAARIPPTRRPPIDPGAAAGLKAPIINHRAATQPEAVQAAGPRCAAR